MGMFDTIACEHPLPDACLSREFQTKSLGSALAAFRLAPTGRLWDACWTQTAAKPI